MARVARPSRRDVARLARGGDPALARDAAKDALDRFGLEALRAAARREHVEPLVGATLESAGVLRADGSDSDWARALAARDAGVDRAFDWLADVAGGWADAGVHHVVVESAGVQLVTGARGARLASSDIDILVREPEPGAAAVVALRRGARMIASRGHRQILALPPLGGAAVITELELATVPFERRWTPIDHGPIDWQLFARPSGDRPSLRVLSPPACFVYQAVHASLHYYWLPPGLRLHAELQQLADHPDFDWSAAAALAERGRFRSRLDGALACLASLYNTVPLEHRPRGPLARIVELAGRGGAPLLRGVLEPLLDDRGPGPWLASVARRWLA